MTTILSDETITRENQIVKLEKVNFSYNGEDEQIRDVSLTILRGEFIVLTGVSGCGKTSLTRLINGLIPHFYEGSLSGKVEIAGKSAAEMASWEFGQVVGSVFQDPRCQFFASIVQDEIAFGCENYGMHPEKIHLCVDRVSKELSIEPLLDSQLATISNGERQKVAVASVRAVGPSIYVMDEPSVNLDQNATQNLKTILAQLKQEGATVIVAEHRLLYLMELADRILYMDNGHIVRQYTPQELKQLSSDQVQQLGLRSPVKLSKSRQTQDMPSEKQELLAAQNIQKRINGESSPLLTNVSLTLRRGEVVALIGKNGSGKSTIARILCGLTRESGGIMRYSDKKIRPSQRARYIWFVMQETDTQLFGDSVLNEMTLGKKKTQALMEKVEQVLRMLDLWEFRNRHPASLSGGQKQRLTIAVAMVQEKDVIILDEPTSGLDGKNMRRVSEILRQEADRGKAILVLSHDEELIHHLCDRVILLQDGVCSENHSLRLGE